MKKTKDAVRRELREQYKTACNNYVAELLRMWELDAYYGYWIGDDAGGVYDYEGSFSIGMGDVIYCVENYVTEGQYLKWQEYICDASEFGFDTPNLRSFLHGCPVTSEETFRHLRELKAGLAKAVAEEKGRIRNETRERNRIADNFTGHEE